MPDKNAGLSEAASTTHAHATLHPRKTASTPRHSTPAESEPSHAPRPPATPSAPMPSHAPYDMWRACTATHTDRCAARRAMRPSPNRGCLSCTAVAVAAVAADAAVAVAALVAVGAAGVASGTLFMMTRAIRSCCHTGSITVASSKVKAAWNRSPKAAGAPKLKSARAAP